jgi:hypothetical protein
MNAAKEKKYVFDGDDYQPERDDERLTTQYDRIFAAMKDTQWRTLSELERITGDPEASISAQIRHMRKKRFGSHTVNKRYMGNGLYEYQLIVNVVEPVADNVQLTLGIADVG